MALSAREMLAEMKRLIGAAEARGIQIRALGGLAAFALEKTAHPLFAREFADLDVVVAKRQRRDFEAFMPAEGYLPDKQFNLLNGAERQIYHNPKNGLKADVFVGDFVMCHKIPLEDRLGVRPLTIPPAELLLSKAQILELNRKDALDILSILFNNEVSENDDGINRTILARLCGADWGLYKTVSMNMERVKDMLAQEALLSPEESAVVLRRVEAVLNWFEEMPKTLAWQVRARVGTRVKWYIEVEEVDREVSGK